MQPVPLILTRPKKANAAFRQTIPPEIAARLRFIDSPLVDIVPLDVPDVPRDLGGAIFTSANGVQYAPDGFGRSAYCVGEMTTRAARAKGWAADCLGQTAAELTERLKSSDLPAPLYHFSGRHVRGDIAGTLSKAGHTVTRVALYDQRLLPLSQAALGTLSTQNPVIVPLFSPRAAAHFAAQAPENASVWALCMSLAVADKVDKTKVFEEVIAKAPTAASMVDAIGYCLQSLAWVEGSERRE